ncbi:translation initiation factor IF-2 [Gilvimarinus sp. SDUM040013]|uniref:Translation initiation factor IF-2 n=1 Tax=Gilvimarinus gilvus TaxID=3058038 RepID=A0ABU4RZB7_9GAMM|nr:translation initiation factor IF-2 [Gilvimarinus sp. SDUM040013]MDO3386736.1 translation initiation factor IF-2 [Gilvimarinus sp. SDUM040013]MDX6848334.1 translation initiation factor IF-2 [Gilvimarinus sp. SDUM040013]
MAEVKVSELAKSVGTPVERLLKQMQEAGLDQTAEDQVVSDEEKQQLLAYLKSSHGESTSEPRKITLKRKTTTTLKAGSGSGRKTVNVEVRKKRTYVKRKPSDDSPELDESLAPEVAEHEAPEVEQEPVVETPAPVSEPEPETAPEPLEQEPVAEEPEAEPEAPSAEPVRSSFVDDIEEKRRAAQERRMAEDAAREAELKKTRDEQKAAEETAKTAKQAPKAKPAAPTAPADAAPAPNKPDTKHGRKKENRRGDFEDDETPRSKRTKSKKGMGPKKSSKADLYELADDDLDQAFMQRRRAARAAHKASNKHGFKKPTQKMIHEVEVPETILVSELAQRMSIKGAEVVKQLMKLGVMATINQPLDQETAQLVVEEMGHAAKLVSENDIETHLEEHVKVEGEEIPRAPVVTVMGHVDHGKTSLLDYIRKAKVASGEAGGITQHIGAYRVPTSHGEVAFLDTPGHAAFTAMRARGAQCTDVVILVVAADDGVMPQTEEAITHARAAGVPIVVAINKCDKESADPDRVKNELAAKEVIPEDWGGDTQFIEVSAHTGDGVDELLEAVSLQAELLELKAVADAPAQGVVVESRVDKGRGVVATLLVQQGTLKHGDLVLAGQSYGRVRAAMNELGQQVKQVGPSSPVEILGLDTAPSAGDEFVVLEDERKAREVAQFRAEKERTERMQRQQAAKLENMFANMDGGEKKILSVVVKADVRGSLEAILASLADIGNDEVEVQVISSGVGGITDNDVNLAMTSNAIVIGFNVRASGSTRGLAEQESIEIRYYSIIYQLLDDVKSALSGMLDPERVEEIVGIADVREVFSSPKFGQVAGCMVTEGTVYRNKPIRVLRDNVVIFEGELESLRRFKDDVNDVRNGMECGIGVKNYDVKVGDQIEVFEVKEVAREL